MVMGVEILIGLSFISAISTVNANAEQKKANAAAYQLERMKIARARRDQIRQSRRAAAAQKAEASVRGMSGGSAIQAVTTNIATQVGSNLGWSNTQAGMQDSIFAHQQKAADWQAFGDMAQSGYNLAQQFPKPKGGG